MIRYNITGAPSKHDLNVRFFNKIDGKRLAIRFAIEGKHNGVCYIEVVINAVSWEDGSGESWCFEGYAPGFNYDRVKGYFCTLDRKGWIRLEKTADITLKEAVELASSNEFILNGTRSAEILKFLYRYPSQIAEFALNVQDLYRVDDRRTPILVLSHVIEEALKSR